MARGILINPCHALYCSHHSHICCFYHIFVHTFQKQFDAVPKRGDGKESVKIIKAMITKGEEPPSEKYLAEQRLAYAALGLTILALVLTGMVKIAKNVAFISISHPIVYWSTAIHNIATFVLIFLIIAHLAAFGIRQIASSYQVCLTDMLIRNMLSIDTHYGIRSSRTKKKQCKRPK